MVMLKNKKNFGRDNNRANAPTRTARIDYVDLIKGVTMFGVVWFHSIACPDWLTATIVNSIFFFLSGIFFKTGHFPEFVKKRAKSMLVPFIVFYLLSYPFRVIVHYWDFRTLEGFDWWCILDVFDVVGRSDYLFVNVPLWFVLCLFVIQVIYYFVSRLGKYVVVLMILATIVLKEFIVNIPTPFMINNACYWIGFFAAGHLCGRYLIGKMTVARNRVILFVVAALAIVLLTALGDVVADSRAGDIFYQVKMYAVVGLLFSVCPFLDGLKVLAPIRFWGLNSLAMLCIHIPALLVFGRIAMKLSGHQSTPLLGFVCAVLTCVVCYFAIRYCNRHCPVIVGKSKPVPPRQ